MAFIESGGQHEQAEVEAPFGDVSPLLTQKAAAELLGKSVKTISRMRERGELGFVKCGGSVWISRDALKCWLDTHSFGPPLQPAETPGYQTSVGRPQQSLFSSPIVSLRDLDAQFDDSEAEG